MVDYYLRIDMPGLPMLNTARNVHWRVKSKHDKTWRADLALRVKRRAFRPVAALPFAKLQLVRRSTTEPDYDNLVQSFKPLIDELVKLGILEDDKPSNIDPRYTWEKARRGKGSVTMIIEEATR